MEAFKKELQRIYDTCGEPSMGRELFENDIRGIYDRAKDRFKMDGVSKGFSEEKAEKIGATLAGFAMRAAFMCVKAVPDTSTKE